MEQFNVLLINLPRYQSVPVTREERCEFVSKYRIDTPATLLIMASLLREKGHRIDFIDANAFNLSYENVSEWMNNKRIDCVVFAINSRILDHDLKICDIAKRVNPACITIGYSWYGRESAREVLSKYSNLDIYIIGPSLSVIGNLMSCLSNSGNLENVGGIAYRDGKIIKANDEIESHVGFNELPLPAYDLLPSFKPYYIVNRFVSPYATVYSGKGCPFRCVFCDVANTKYSARSAETIIEELKILKRLGNIRFVWFYDEVFTINRERVIEVCERIIKENLDIKWFCDSRVELVDEELLKIMKKGGCIGISYGVESGSQKILDSMHKGNTVEQAKNALIWTRKAHIPVQLNLVLGFIGEDEETLRQTESLVRDTLPEKLQIAIVSAKPGSEFAKLVIKNAWADDSVNWDQNLAGGLALRNYEPFNLNLNDEKIKLRKMLYYNPKWWIKNISTVLRNRELFLASIYSVVQEVKLKFNP